MKKVILGLAVLSMAFFATTAQAQGDATKSNQTSGAQIEFTKDVHDYGTIEQKADGTCEFEFVNNGTEPLVISNCKGSCGCTVPTWPRKPINPGEKETIKVKYDTNRLGGINKTVTIFSNASNEPTKTVSIKGTVVAATTDATEDAAK